MTLIKFLRRYEKELKKKFGKRKGIVITVSGLSGSGKTEVAKFIAKRLGLKYHSGGSAFRKLAAEQGKSLEDFCRVREAWVDHKIEKETLKTVMQKNVVVDARLSGWVAGKTAFKIFVSCPLGIRAKRVAKRDKIAVKEALKKVAQRDENDIKKYLKLYKIDMNDKSIYDKVIDNSKSRENLKRELKLIVNQLTAKKLI